MKYLKIIYSFIFTEQEFYFLLKFFIFFQFRSKILTDFFRKLMIVRYGVYIGRRTHISKNVIFPHPSNIVIGEGVFLDENVVIYQGVTLGIDDRNKNVNYLNSYPHVSKNVTIYANCTIVGDIFIGDNSIIGANSFINKSVQNNSVCYGINLIKKK